MSLSPTARRLLEEFDEAAQAHGGSIGVDWEKAFRNYGSTKHQLEAFIEELERKAKNENDT